MPNLSTHKTIVVFMVIFSLLSVHTPSLRAQTEDSTALEAYNQAAEAQRGRKITTNLIEIDEDYQAYQQAGAQGDFSPGVQGASVTNQTIVIEAVASGSTNALLQDLQALGFQQIAAFNRTISGRLPLSAIAQLDGLATLQFAYIPQAFTEAGSVDSQANSTMRATVARNEFNVDGTGVTVGVISDAYNCLGGAAADVASGDLPNNVIVLAEGNCNGAIDEGRAMMQLIHDIAPGATLLFHEGFQGEASLATAIRALRDAGADIIVDDVTFFGEGYYQDDIAAQAADEVVLGGIPYFTAAGNRATQSYEAPYRPGRLVGDFVEHDFDPGVGVDTFQQVILPPSTSVLFSFQWDDPHFSISGGAGASSNMAFVIWDATISDIIAFSNIDNVGNDPIEILTYTNTTQVNETVNIALVKFGGTDPTTLKYIYSIRSGGGIQIEYPTNSSTSFGHKNSAFSAGVAASGWFQSPPFTQTVTAETFTSLGGLPILFDIAGNRLPQPVVRPQPLLTANDGISNTFFGEGNFFFGTSAAAPNAAAVAALLLECNPNLGPFDVYTAMTTTALDANPADFAAPGYDFFTGAGLIQADAALEQACNFPLASLDVNNDNVITPADAAFVTNRLGQAVIGGNTTADVNGDGFINQADVNAVIRRIGEFVP